MFAKINQDTWVFSYHQNIWCFPVFPDSHFPHVLPFGWPVHRMLLGLQVFQQHGDSRARFESLGNGTLRFFWLWVKTLAPQVP
jgi:hypothetical protein